MNKKEAIAILNITSSENSLNKIKYTNPFQIQIRKTNYFGSVRKIIFEL